MTPTPPNIWNFSYVSSFFFQSFPYWGIDYCREMLNFHLNPWSDFTVLLLSCIHQLFNFATDIFSVFIRFFDSLYFLRRSNSPYFSKKFFIYLLYHSNLILWAVIVCLQYGLENHEINSNFDLLRFHGSEGCSSFLITNKEHVIRLFF